ncbi:MAG: ribosome biogenesis GTP-binding protein YihA/YsxC [Coriobacteriales bacterium]|nr:ribosome biogenesis GTP-binding protein YihA/YsxC [Coriobacteriales bacterium]
MAIRFESARFEAAYGTAKQLPESTTPEVAFAGRSNVGKSSLINKLVGRKALARTSSQPGKTANINFYEADGIRLVDLPGYGYAKVSGKERQRWADLIAGYFDQERSFNLVVALVDIRHDAQKLDVQMLNFLRDAQLPFVVALTKADKLSRTKQDQQAASLARQFGIPRSQVIVTSSQKGTGINELRRAITEACD